MAIDMTKVRQDPQYDRWFLDDSGETLYVWVRNEDEDWHAVFICTEIAYKEADGLSDVSSNFLGETPDGEGQVYDATFDPIRKEMMALGFDEGSESTWTADDQGQGSVDALVKFVEAHPRFRHCPEM